MSKNTRIFVLILAVLFITALAGAGVAVAAVYQAGSIAVDVTEPEGGRIRLTVPAALAQLAIAVAPESVVREAAGELRPYLPAARAGWNELSRAPDFVLFELDGSGEHVRVEKQGRRLVVLVDSDDARVEVGVPLRTVESLLSRLDARVGHHG